MTADATNLAKVPERESDIALFARDVQGATRRCFEQALAVGRVADGLYGPEATDETSAAPRAVTDGALGTLRDALGDLGTAQGELDRQLARINDLV